MKTKGLSIDIEKDTINFAGRKINVNDVITAKKVSTEMMKMKDLQEKVKERIEK